MPLSLSTPSANRLCQLLVLLLLALGLLAGVSLSKSRDSENQATHTQAVVLPALQWVHTLAGRVDEQRGMAALHITLQSDAERQALEVRLQASRQQLERQMAAFSPRLADAADRQHHATVLAGLAGFWDAQDKLLAASRLAAQDPAAAQLARAMLVGEAQLAFERVRAAIDAWRAETGRQADVAASEATAAAHQLDHLAWAQAMLTALALAVAWGLMRQPLPVQLRAVSDAWALDGAEAHQHLQALNDAVALARRGEPGRAAGLSAVEAQRLAEQVDSATRALRRLIDQPAAAALADPPADPAPADPPDRPGSPAQPH